MQWEENPSCLIAVSLCYGNKGSEKKDWMQTCVHLSPHMNMCIVYTKQKNNGDVGKIMRVKMSVCILPCVHLSKIH